MFQRRTRSISALLGGSNSLELNGLSAEQAQACHEVRGAFLESYGLAPWGLNVSLGEDGPKTWRLEIVVVASADFDRQIRSTQVTVDRTIDLAQVVEHCLEAHYNACMNRKAMQSSNRRAGDRLPNFIIANA
jgi:hypothetical protein